MNVAHLVNRIARHDRSLAAVTAGGTRWTYGELADRVARTAGAFRCRHGLAPGARVAIAMENSPAYLQIMFGCWQAGLCVVPMNAKLHPKEFAYILENSGASLCVVSPALHDGIAAEAKGLPGLKFIPTDSEAFARLTEEAPLTPAERAPADPAWLFYTSGTTGRPKGATLTLRNLFFMTICHYADIDAVEAGDTLLHAAPLSHGSGLYALPHMAKGGHQVIPASGHFQPDEIFGLIAEHRNVSVFAVPTMLVRLINSPAASTVDFTNLRTIIYGGSPMYIADLQRALDCLGPKLVQIYGQGESPVTITSLSKADHAARTHPRYRDRLASCGIARTGVEVHVVDADDRDLPLGEVGEVITRSDCVMAGYWNDPAASAQTLRGGWLHTGDVGSLDEDGFLTLKDRSKDLIISGGSNVYPREIEEVLLRHADVVEASVVGAPHPEWGEEVVAFVVRKPGSRLADADLDALCLDHIARFKRPRRYLFVEELPKNNYGKVLKSELRRRLADASCSRASSESS